MGLGVPSAVLSFVLSGAPAGACRAGAQRRGARVRSGRDVLPYGEKIGSWERISLGRKDAVGFKEGPNRVGKITASTGNNYRYLISLHFNDF